MPSPRAARFAFVFALILAVLAAAVASAAPTFPPLTGRVVDDAGLLDPGTQTALTRKLEGLEQQTKAQLVVVTLKSLQGYDIADYGYQLGRAWGIGQKDKNTGALLIVAPNERKVRIEVGYGLEGTLTDAVSHLIIENDITPRFRKGDYAGGIAKGVDDLAQVIAGGPLKVDRRARQDSDSDGDWGSFLIVALFLGIWIANFLGGGGGGFGPGGRRGGFGGLPFPMGGGGSSRRSGGGFSGGGGTFGGGGASGGW